jgi:phospholipid-transporting ATPase
LKKVLCDESLKKSFLDIGVLCRSVICSRVTPLQKSQVVKMVKDAYPNIITLAIGDGANDVSMIQEAHIGVGIMGREGTQAVRAADYAFGEFRFLKRLVMVHGRYNYLRLSNLILYCFYKNLVFITVQFIYGFTNMWSGQLVYEELFFSTFNMFFTALPPLFYGIYERDLPDSILEKIPKLFIEVRDGLYWNIGKIMYWLAVSLISALLIFLAVYGMNFDGTADLIGRSTGYWVQCYLFSTPMLLVVTFKMATMTRFWIWPIIWGLGISIALNIGVMFLLIVLDSLYVTDYATAVITHALPPYYILCVLMPAACIVPDIAAQ